MGANPIVALDAPGRGQRAAAERGHGWFAIVAAGTVGAVLAGVGVAAFGLGERVVDRPVVERVALNPVAVAPGLKDPSVHDIRRLVAPGVVGIGPAVDADTEAGGRAVAARRKLVGSGVVLRNDGIVVTSASLLRSGKVWVRLPDGTTVEAEVVGSDPVTGLGVLDLGGSGYTPSVVAPVADLMSGERTYGVTAQADGGVIMAAGVVGSATRYVGPTGGAVDGIAVTGQPTHLALGGALADPRGAVTGITTAVDEDEAWFVTPVEAVDKAVDDLLRDGRVHACWLGIEGTDVPDPDKRGSTSGGGTAVTSVIADSPADAGGLEVGDVVVGLDDRQITGTPGLNIALRAYSPGDRVDVDVDRPDGSQVTLVLTLTEQPARL